MSWLCILCNLKFTIVLVHSTSCAAKYTWRYLKHVGMLLHMSQEFHWACSQRKESCSEIRFGSRSASWLGSWFELHAFTSIANAVPITNRICALRGNILFLLRSPRWLTHAWPQRAFPKCARTTRVPSFAFTFPQNQAFYADHDPKRPFFMFQKPDLKELCLHKG